MIKILMLSVLSALAWDGRNDIYQGKVIAVEDGNTIEVETKEEGVIKVMLSEADCPELTQEFGEEAKAFTIDLIYKKKVIVEMKGKDRWGNKLAVIKLKNGKTLHEELIKNGLAWPPVKSASQLASLAEQAKSKKEGLWSAEDPMEPWVYRRKQTMLQPKSLD
ncbi:MAG: thermonuclease family protein [Fulvivirga sp.]